MPRANTTNSSQNDSTLLDSQSMLAFAAAVNMMNDPLGLNHLQEKPIVGSEAHRQQRKITHREVERRRRDTINEFIKKLGDLIPGRGKNKGSILERTIDYIMELRQLEHSNTEKWYVDKMLYEQAYHCLTRIDQYNMQVEHLQAENNHLRMLSNSRGIPDERLSTVADNMDHFSRQI